MHRIVLILLIVSTTLLGQSANNRVAKMQEDFSYLQALKFIESDYDRWVEELIELTEIPAPPFKEEARARVYLQKLSELGLQNVEMDLVGNVMGLRTGAGTGGPLLAVAAHLDTVFPEGTDVEVQRNGTRLSAPGIGDDTAGLATLLAVIRAFDASNILTLSDILFIGNVGEEGPGDLRGMKYLFLEGPYKDKIKLFVAVEGGRQADITNAALGSKRYRITFKGPGGHSFSAFGLVNPAFAMANAMKKFSELQVPSDPRTTFNVGIVGGGTSVNSIPADTWMDVDLRSEDPEELDALAETFLGLMHEAVEEENSIRSTAEGSLRLEIKMIGDRPSGEVSVESSIVQLATAAYRSFGIEPIYSRSSTDANIPISLGIPGITIDRGGLGGRSHSLDEWTDVRRAETVKGIQVVLTTILAIAGLQE